MVEYQSKLFECEVEQRKRERERGLERNDKRTKEEVMKQNKIKTIFPNNKRNLRKKSEFLISLSLRKIVWSKKWKEKEEKVGKKIKEKKIKQ